MIKKLITAFWFTTRFWERFKFEPYWGDWEPKIGAIGSELAADYHWLDKREKFHQKVFGDIDKYWKLVGIDTSVK
ncbi:MAG: hypothetical protein MRERC_4c098 [Mycoplasmataceae bacterium RC_NB112A]|nr:MAG: hypothetical protein MRERC_4c098 [Mycoplasmataceae bacterium RC_NB112A]